MNRVVRPKIGIVSGILLGALVATAGSAGAVDLFLLGADSGATATAAAKCSYGEATAHAKGVGTASASASSSADIDGVVLSQDGASSYEDGVATSDSYASGVGPGYASASASASGDDGSSARANHSCDLRFIRDIIGVDIEWERPALAPSYGCLAAAGSPAAAFDGEVRVDAVTGAAWFVGTATRDGVPAPIAVPVGDALVLTATQAGALAPPTLRGTGVPFAATFDEGSCESRIG